MSEKKKTEKETFELSKELQEFLPESEVSKDSIKKMIDAGVILPQLKPELNQVYRVKVISEPYEFTSEFGLTKGINVLYDGMKFSLITPTSFKTQLVANMVRLKLNFKTLIGKTLVVQKVIGSTKEFKNAKLYSVQIE